MMASLFIPYLLSIPCIPYLFRIYYLLSIPFIPYSFRTFVSICKKKKVMKAKTVKVSICMVRLSSYLLNG